MSRSILLFLCCFISRVLFKLLSGYNNFELFTDSIRYDNLSNEIIAGQANMDIVAYLSAPLYSYTLALIKLLTGENWQFTAVAYQFTLVSISAVYIYKISFSLFNNKHLATFASLAYIFYPLTLWYNFTLTQETSFQSFLIIALFYLLQAAKHHDFKHIIKGAVFYSLALLTKSHIILLLPFIILVLVIGKRFKQIVILLTILFIATLPHGLTNYNKHGVYTLSSHGNASFFLLAHSDQTYPCLLKSAGDKKEFSSGGCDPTFVFDINYDFVGHGKVNALSVAERNKKRFELAFNWILDNPNKFIELKIFGLKRFILPGLDWYQFKFSFWLVSLLIGLLIYIPGYWALYKGLRSNWQNHIFMLALILICAAIFIVFFPVNRFRVITMEPLLIVYATSFYFKLWQNRKHLNSNS